MALSPKPEHTVDLIKRLASPILTVAFVYHSCREYQCHLGEITIIDETWNRDCLLSIDEVLSKCMYDERSSIRASFLDLDEEWLVAYRKQLHFAMYLLFPIYNDLFCCKEGILSVSKEVRCHILLGFCGIKVLRIKEVIDNMKHSRSKAAPPLCSPLNSLAVIWQHQK
jgi:hypothetical protein